MTGKVRFHERGSAIIMAVGLLVMLAMMGTTFFAITYLDRKDAASIATAAPMKSVALGVLAQIRAERGKDLRFSATGGPYSAAANPQQAIDHAGEEADPMLASSHPFHLGGSVWLWAHLSNPGGDLPDCVQLVTVDGVIAVGPRAGQRIDEVDLDNDPIPVPDLDWVDTDGFGYRIDLGSGLRFYDGDAILRDSGVRDRLGRSFYVAVRVVDASALLNANLHHSPTPAGVGKPMPITDVSLEALLGQTIRDAVHNVRARRGSTPIIDSIEDYWRNYALSPLNPGNAGPPLFAVSPPYKPFDISDMLALIWGGGSPSTTSGRLFQAFMVLGDPAGRQAFGARRSFMTTHSAGRCLVPEARDETAQLRQPARQKVKVDLNANLNDPNARFFVLYTAFRNLLAHLGDPERAKVAAQVAVNVIDFSDHEAPGVEEIVTTQSVAGAIVCGIERQPFITEAGYTLQLIDDPMPPVGYFGIELYNPYVSDINLKGWKVKCGGAEQELTGSIPAGGRLAIVSDGRVRVSGDSQRFPGLDLRQEALILRPSRLIGGAPGADALVGKVGPGDFKKDPNLNVPPLPGESRFECIRRCDTRAAALYSMALYKKDIQVDITVSDTLGSANSVVPDELRDPEAPDPASARLPQPCPVYVRNGPFINVGELNRIFWVGPTANEPLDVQLVSKPACDPYEVTASNGRLSMYGGITVHSGTPALPPGCLAGDFFMVHSPRSDGYDNDGDNQAQPDEADEDIVYGFININTAPEMVLNCLPGLTGLSDDPPGQGIRSKVVREILHYRDKLPPYRTTPRSTLLGIPSLRNGAGFASPGEIAIPIRRRASQPDIVVAYRLPQNEYPGANVQPYNYTVAENDGSGNPITAHDDGLPTALGPRVNDDLIKRHVYYSWLSNHITVRSDVYIAYIRVDVRRGPQDAPLAVRRYAAVIDRSNCRTAADRPNVLMFAEIK